MHVPASASPAAPARSCATSSPRHVLGLPQDVRVDKNVPFNQLGKKG